MPSEPFSHHSKCNYPTATPKRHTKPSTHSHYLKAPSGEQVDCVVINKTEVENLLIKDGKNLETLSKAFAREGAILLDKNNNINRVISIVDPVKNEKSSIRGIVFRLDKLRINVTDDEAEENFEQNDDQKDQ